MRFKQIRCMEDLISLIGQIGFLPYFKNEIPGFSIEETCLKELWFTEIDGPWEWKSGIIQSKSCMYGKFFKNKAGYISRKWIPDFVNMRRDGYDFDALYDDGLAAQKDNQIFDTIAEEKEILSTALKKKCNYSKGGNKGFDTVLNRLQMQGYVCIADFVDKRDKSGNVYGWATARYTTPENIFGYDYVTSAYKRDSSESRKCITEHIKKILPDISEEIINKFIC